MPVSKDQTPFMLITGQTEGIRASLEKEGFSRMNFSKKQALAKTKALKSPATHRIHKVKVIASRLFLIVFIVCSLIGISALAGAINGLMETAPSIESINVVPDGYATKILNAKGKIVQTLVGKEANREYTTLDKIPIHLQNAFVAIEDERFWTHDGIDLQGIFRATYLGLSNGGEFRQGASTITQQLLKNQVFGGGEETTLIQKIERKIQEQYLAIQLENKLSKKQIMEYYLNTINLGQNTLGVQAASKRYFGKDVSELTISESAVLAGITQNPSGYNPITHPKKNGKKRLTILSYMKEQGYITSEEYDEAMADKVYARIKSVNKDTIQGQTATSFFTDSLIDQIITDMKEELSYTETQAYNTLYRGGLTIYSTQDSSMQKVCDKVINTDAYYPSDSTYQLNYQLTVTDENGKASNYNAGTMINWFAKKKNMSISLYYSDKKGADKYIKIYKKAMSKGKTVDGEKIEYVIQPQVSFLVLDQHTGQVKAITGGRGEKTASRTLNRATTSLRQPGSTFKVLSTYLPALDTADMNLATVQEDEPYYYPGTKRLVKNWYSGYRGSVTIRTAIADSMNVIAVKTLEQVTPKIGYDYLLNLGFTSLVDSYTDSSGKIFTDIALPMALGGLTKGVSNLELTSAFASIANGGVYNKPTFYTKVIDHDGNVLLDKSPSKVTEIDIDGNQTVTYSTPTSKQVMKDSTAWLLTDAMQDVVKSGTGTAVNFSNIQMPLAGKTGTTTDNKDLWFVGYTPYLTAGIWGGYDASEEQSNTTYHKAIWKAIMEKLNSRYETAEFEKPKSVISVYICTKCGKLAPEGHYGSTYRKEYFAKGSVPTETCRYH